MGLVERATKKVERMQKFEHLERVKQKCPRCGHRKAWLKNQQLTCRKCGNKLPQQEKPVDVEDVGDNVSLLARAKQWMGL